MFYRYSRSGILSRLIKKKEPTNKTISVISGPTNVIHEVHLGWDARDGFKVRNIPLEWRKLFQAAGLFLAPPSPPFVVALAPALS